MAAACYDKSGAVTLQLGELDAAEREFESALAIDASGQTALRLRQEAFRLKQGGR
ncbi:MAG: hypothetical protein WB683_04090 [Candidatus Sulfotelmatobacter sp.]